MKEDEPLFTPWQLYDIGYHDAMSYGKYNTFLGLWQAYNQGYDNGIFNRNNLK